MNNLYEVTIEKVEDLKSTFQPSKFFLTLEEAFAASDAIEAQGFYSDVTEVEA
jgi:hypothetical protein